MTRLALAGTEASHRVIAVGPDGWRDASARCGITGMRKLIAAAPAGLDDGPAEGTFPPPDLLIPILHPPRLIVAERGGRFALRGPASFAAHGGTATAESLSPAAVVVMAAEARDVEPAEAAGLIAGLTIALLDGASNAPASGAMGPWIETAPSSAAPRVVMRAAGAEAVSEPLDLAAAIAAASRLATLGQGDVICVPAAAEAVPAGGTVSAEIEGVGTLSVRIVG